MSTPAKRVNGKKGIAAPTCPHSDECVANHHHEAVMASLDALSEQMCNALMGLADVRERQTVAEQREAEWMLTLGNVERALAALGGSNA